MEKVKKRVISTCFLWATALVLSLGVPSQNTIVHAETMVYVTPTGSKYHSRICGNGNYTLTTLSDALARGLTPCSKCYGSGYSPSPEPEPAPAPTPAPQPEPEPTPAPKPVKINKTSILLVKGQTAKLKLTNASGTVSWSSSKNSVATVTGKGKVAAKKKGKAVITAKTATDTKKCKVTVEDPKLNLKKVSLEVRQTKTLKLSGCKHSVKWSSSDSSIAKVSNGRITATGVGSAKISAKTHGKTFTCKVTVKKPKVKKVVLAKSSLQMGYGKWEELKVRTVPADAMDYYDISVKTSNASIVSASADNYDCLINLESKYASGKAVISVSVGGALAQCSVTVAPDPVETLQLSDEFLFLDYPDGYTSISYETEPYEAANYYEPIWKSGNENVAIVKASSARGYANIQAIGEGETDITLTLGNKTATCHVVVRQ